MINYEKIDYRTDNYGMSYMILSNEDIKNEIKTGTLKVHRLNKDTIRENGLDLTISEIYSIEDNRYKNDNKVVDLHNQESNRFIKGNATNGEIFIYSKEFILLSTREIIEIPTNIMTFCALRSTIARSGLIAPPTVVDCGFKGALTIEIFNASNRTIKLYAGDRFLHVVLAYTKTPCSNPYHGLYQGQQIVTPPKKSVL